MTSIDRWLEGHPDGEISRSDFAELVATCIFESQAFDSVEVVDDSEIHAEMPSGDAVRVRLDRLWSECSENPATRESRLARFVRIVARRMSADVYEGLDQNALLPVLRPAGYGAEVDAPSVRFSTDLEIYFVVDRGESVAVMAAEPMIDAGLSLRDAHGLAIENLGARLGRLRIEREGRIFAARLDGFYDSSVVLHPTVVDKMHKTVGGKLAVAMPEAGTLLFCPIESYEAVEELTIRAREVFACSDRQLSPTPTTVPERLGQVAAKVMLKARDVSIRNMATDGDAVDVAVFGMDEDVYAFEAVNIGGRIVAAFKRFELPDGGDLWAVEREPCVVLARTIPEYHLPAMRLCPARLLNLLTPIEEPEGPLENMAALLRNDSWRLLARGDGALEDWTGFGDGPGLERCVPGLFALREGEGVAELLEHEFTRTYPEHDVSSRVLAVENLPDENEDDEGVAFAVVERAHGADVQRYGLLVGYAVVPDPERRGERMLRYKLIPEWLHPRDTGGPRATMPEHMLRMLSPEPASDGFSTRNSEMWRRKWELENRVRNATPETFAGRYPEPVQRLLTFGGEELPNLDARLGELGLTARHVPDLVRVAVDLEIVFCAGKQPQTYAQIFALAALMHLRPSPFPTDLLALFEHVDDLTYLRDFLPTVVVALGDASMVEALSVVFEQRREPDLSFWPVRFAMDHDGDEETGGLGLWPPAEDPRYWATVALLGLGHEKKSLAPAVTAVLVRVLEDLSQSPRWLVTMIVKALRDWGAAEALAVIERAYEARAVDDSECGDLETVVSEITERARGRSRSVGSDEER
jgi:uncharacterized protein YtpQ (UPF0354 family)